jgi:glycosyltransferase involved in cell wall biosynthesis
VASYNGEKYLKEQMDSLLGQTYPHIRIEVCDDGSSDGTCDIIREYEKKDARVTLCRNEKNQGYVKNFLLAVKRAGEPYIMLCDQDDIWNPDKVETTLRAMKEEEAKYPQKPILVYTDAMNYDSEKQVTMGCFHENSHLDTKKVDTAHLFMENKIIGCTVMLNQQIVPYLAELPDEIRVHDWWLALICSHFGRIVYCPEPTLLYRQHAGNMIGGSSYSGYLKKRLAQIKKQRKILYQTFLQGEAFVRLFHDRMDERQRAVAEAFAGMKNAGGVTRRYRMLRYGFTKSGLIRNIGLFLLL